MKLLRNSNPMAKDKYDFIQEVLESKKLTPAQRERVLALAKEEIRKDAEFGVSLDYRVKVLEQSLIKNSELNPVPLPDNETKNIFDEGLLNSGEFSENFPAAESLFDQNNSTSEKLNTPIPRIAHDPQMVHNIFNNREQGQTSSYFNNDDRDALVKVKLEHFTISEYKDPSLLYRFLLLYNQDPVLRSTCHDFDEDMLKDVFGSGQPYDFNIHLIKIKEAFKSLQKKSNYRGYMATLIYNFINGGSWSSQKINFGWSDVKLQLWSQKNPGMMPHPDEIFSETLENEGYKLEKPFISEYNGKSVGSFTEFVLFFKYLWHIKKPNTLKSLIERRTELYGFKKWADIIIDPAFSTTTNHYTDVDKLLQAYVKIINMVKKIREEDEIVGRPQFNINFYEEEVSNCIVFSIHHLDSVFGKSIKSTVEKPFGQLMKSLIRSQINGLCDLYIRAEFEGKRYAEINIWNGEKPIDKPLETFTGVQYLLKFRK